jgi:L-lactate dehydrogenase (cytochrome)
MIAASAIDYREIARRRLPRFLFEYIDGGSYAEVTLRRNVSDLENVELRQRVLTAVDEVDLTTTLFGQPMAMPLALGPIGLGGLTARRGERQAVRAAEAAGVPFCLSTVSACPLEEVTQAATRPFWFQLYMIRDRAFMRDLFARARAANCSALVFTVDMPLPGSRYRDYHSGLAGAPGWRGALRRTLQGMGKPGWAWDVGIHGRPHSIGNLAPVLGGKSGIDEYLGWMKRNFDATSSWKDLDFIRSEWGGPLIIKGILDAEDAREAARMGADGIIVSNHGGRQLDGAPSTAAALPPIVEAVADRLTVLADGGVRSGLDVVRMLALGAKGVMLGRAWAYALAGDGGRGVSHVLGLIRAEMAVAMALTGARTVAAISSEMLARPRAA